MAEPSYTAHADLSSGQGWQGTPELFGRLGEWQRWKHSVSAAMAEVGFTGPYWEWCAGGAVCEWTCEGAWHPSAPTSVILAPDDEALAWADALKRALRLCSPQRPGIHRTLTDALNVEGTNLEFPPVDFKDDD